MIQKQAKLLFRALCSLKLAIMVIMALAASLATGTILESAYDTPTAQYWVYHALWFQALLSLLGIQIISVALSRLPWKKRHIPFLLAHLGIVLLLWGSFVTQVRGLDGSMRIAEGDTSSLVEINQPTLVLSDGTTANTVRIPWTPPEAEFKPLSIPAYGLRVDRFIAHADPNVSFVPADKDAASDISRPLYPAAHVRIEGGFMRIKQDFWLWGGDASWSTIQAGPATLSLGNLPPAGMKRPWLSILAQGGQIQYTAFNSSGEKRQGRVPASEPAKHVIQPGWKGNIQVTILDWIPKAVSHTTYEPSRMQHGEQAPMSAIHVAAGSGGEGSETWLGMGDRAVLQYRGKEVSLGYSPQRVVLPFSIRLEHFQVDHYAGTNDPSEFSSRVAVVDSGAKQDPITISMNEPLKYRGITFYQASYEDAEPRPTVSIFSVNQDPGRPIKYLGSLLIVFGTILLYASRVRKAKTA